MKVESKELIRVLEEAKDRVLCAQKWAVVSLLCSAFALIISVILLALH